MMLDSSIPVGGSSGCSHEHSAAIDEAARWLATQPPGRIGGPVVLVLIRRFGLNAQQACQAAREAHLIRARAM